MRYFWGLYQKLPRCSGVPIRLRDWAISTDSVGSALRGRAGRVGRSPYFPRYRQLRGNFRYKPLFFTPTETAFFRGSRLVREGCWRISPHGATCAGTASWERSCPARKWDGEAAADQCGRDARVFQTRRSQDAVSKSVRERHARRRPHRAHTSTIRNARQWGDVPAWPFGATACVRRRPGSCRTPSEKWGGIPVRWGPSRSVDDSVSLPFHSHRGRVGYASKMNPGEEPG